MEGLQSLVNLRELYLSHNGIEVIEGLENNVRHGAGREEVAGDRVEAEPALLRDLSSCPLSRPPPNCPGPYPSRPHHPAPRTQAPPCRHRSPRCQGCADPTSGSSLLFQNKLTMLDIAANRIRKIENISHLTELQEFWVSAPSVTGSPAACAHRWGFCLRRPVGRPVWSTGITGFPASRAWLHVLTQVPPRVPR